MSAVPGGEAHCDEHVRPIGEHFRAVLPEAMRFLGERGYFLRRWRGSIRGCSWGTGGDPHHVQIIAPGRIGRRVRPLGGREPSPSAGSARAQVCFGQCSVALTGEALSLPRGDEDRTASYLTTPMPERRHHGGQLLTSDAKRPCRTSGKLETCTAEPIVRGQQPSAARSWRCGDGYRRPTARCIEQDTGIAMDEATQGAALCDLTLEHVSGCCLCPTCGDAVSALAARCRPQGPTQYRPAPSVPTEAISMSARPP